MRDEESLTTPHKQTGATPQTLSGLLATVQGNISAQAHTLRNTHTSALSQVPLGVPHLRFSLANSSCLLPLDRLGGVLASQPRLNSSPFRLPSPCLSAEMIRGF